MDLPSLSDEMTILFYKAVSGDEEALEEYHKLLQELIDELK